MEPAGPPRSGVGMPSAIAVNKSFLLTQRIHGAMSYKMVSFLSGGRRTMSGPPVRRTMSVHGSITQAIKPAASQKSRVRSVRPCTAWPVQRTSPQPAMASFALGLRGRLAAGGAPSPPADCGGRRPRCVPLCCCCPSCGASCHCCCTPRCSCAGWCCGALPPSAVLEPPLSSRLFPGWSPRCCWYSAGILFCL